MPTHAAADVFAVGHQTDVREPAEYRENLRLDTFLAGNKQTCEVEEGDGESFREPPTIRKPEARAMKPETNSGFNSR